MQIEALRADKRGLDKVLEQRQGELSELHERLKGSMVLSLTLVALISHSPHAIDGYYHGTCLRKPNAWPCSCIDVMQHLRTWLTVGTEQIFKR